MIFRDFSEINDFVITAFSLFFALLPRDTAVNRVFLKDLHYIEDISISEMLVFTEIESSKVCHTKKDVSQKLLVRRHSKSQIL